VKTFIFSLLLIAQSSFASSANDAIKFISSVLPTGSTQSEWIGTNLDDGKECKLQIDYTEQKGGKFSIGSVIYVNLYISNKGNVWPVKFVADESSASNRFISASINEDQLIAQNLSVPGEQYSSKERQTLIMNLSQDEFEVEILNEEKSWFLYREKYRAHCSFKI
jgi:hypothetical protein